MVTGGNIRKRWSPISEAWQFVRRLAIALKIAIKFDCLGVICDRKLIEIPKRSRFFKSPHCTGFNTLSSSIFFRDLQVNNVPMPYTSRGERPVAPTVPMGYYFHAHPLPTPITLKMGYKTLRNRLHSLARFCPGILPRLEEYPSPGGR